MASVVAGNNARSRASGGLLACARGRIWGCGPAAGRPPATLVPPMQSGKLKDYAPPFAVVAREQRVCVASCCSTRSASQLRFAVIASAADHRPPFPPSPSTIATRPHSTGATSARDDTLHRRRRSLPHWQSLVAPRPHLTAAVVTLGRRALYRITTTPRTQARTHLPREELAGRADHVQRAPRHGPGATARRPASGPARTGPAGV